MSQFPPTTPGSMVQPHRGTLILVLGILGIVVCFICGIVAWVMGNQDLRAMAAGTMDRSGEGTTKAGKICGMISVILACVGIGIWVLMLLLAGGMAAAGAAGAAGAGGP
jgi:hypothetical protein